MAVHHLNGIVNDSTAQAHFDQLAVRNVDHVIVYFHCMSCQKVMVQVYIVYIGFTSG